MFRKNSGLVLGLLALSACTNVERPVDPLSQMLSDPAPFFHGDDIYLLSRMAGCLLKVTPGKQTDTAYTEQKDASTQCIGVGEYPESMFVSKSGSQVLVMGSTATNDSYLAHLNLDQSCTGEFPLDAGCVKSWETRNQHDLLIISPDERFAITYHVSNTSLYSDSVVVNPNEIQIYDLQTGETRAVTVGYNPRDFAFTTLDPSHPQAVVLTDTLVVLVDLLSGSVTQRELTLSTDYNLYPQDVIISNDETTALVTINQSADLFTFDLTQDNLPINILSLSGYPSQIVKANDGVTAMVLADNRELNFIDLNNLSISVVTLSNYIDQLTIPAVGNYFIGWMSDASGYPLYYIDATERRAQAYEQQNPVSDVRISPDGGVLFLSYNGTYSSYSDQYSYYGQSAIAILNLAQGDRQSSPLLVNSLPPDVVFFDGPTNDTDIAYFPLNAGYDEETEQYIGAIVKLNLSNYSTEVVETAPFGARIGSIENGERIAVVHQSSTGFISIFPRDNPQQVQFITDFMLTGIFNGED